MKMVAWFSHATSGFLVAGRLACLAASISFTPQRTDLCGSGVGGEESLGNYRELYARTEVNIILET